MAELTENREGSLDAPSRQPLDWKNPEFYDQDNLNRELERVFDICHGCRRCVSLCNSFPTLFDLVDESETMEVDGVDKADYGKVVDQCYLCDLCFMTKCPYVPPHSWNVDFPHLMLRAKAIKHRNGDTTIRDRVLSEQDTVGSIAGMPVISEAFNAVSSSAVGRLFMEKTLGIHRDAHFPFYHRDTLRKRFSDKEGQSFMPEPTSRTRGKVAVFVTCYGNRNEPELVEDMVAVLEHNGIDVRLTGTERCCGMPKLEIGDLESAAAAKEVNIPELKRLIDDGYDIVAPIPSCVLMFKQEIPLMFPEDEDVHLVRKNIFDPFEYLALRHKEGRLKLDFENSLGEIAYHAPCHQRVQNIGPKTRDILSLVPGTSIQMIDRCSGHDGTYGVRQETHEISRKICRPILNKIKRSDVDHVASDCPLAAHHIVESLEEDRKSVSPFGLLRLAYGI
ncbi:MAG: heterodisulfide reductase-related iron-sulfur binding cluster [Methylococcales bacterium]|nr:heterodisulfide reductase-related iron-sulfur binding cluster [Methylococcales bacterium]